jgi:hypothetical protein
LLLLVAVEAVLAVRLVVRSVVAVEAVAVLVAQRLVYLSITRQL